MDERYTHRGENGESNVQQLKENSSSEVFMNFKLRLPRKELIDHM